MRKINNKETFHDKLINELEVFLKSDYVVDAGIFPEYEMFLKKWNYKIGKEEGEVDLIGVLDSNYLNGGFMLADLFEVKSMDNKNLKRSGCYQLTRSMQLLDGEIITNSLYLYTVKGLYKYSGGQLEFLLARK